MPNIDSIIDYENTNTNTHMKETKNNPLSISDADKLATQIMCKYTCAETWEELIHDDWSSVDVHSILMDAFLAQNKETH